MSPDAQTEVSQLQPTVGRFAEIPYDQMTPEQQEVYRSLIDAEGLEPGAALPSTPLKIWVRGAQRLRNPRAVFAIPTGVTHRVAACAYRGGSVLERRDFSMAGALMSMAVEASIDGLLRAAIEQKRLIQRSKP